MIEQCQQFLAEADAAVTVPDGGGDGDVGITRAAAAAPSGRVADMATGMFSWRLPPDGTGMTIVAS